MTDASQAVEVLGAAWCVDTARTLRCLRRLRVPFVATDVDDHLDALDEVTRLTGGERRTPVVRVGAHILVEPSNAALVAALERARVLAPSTVHAFEHGQNIGDLERLLRLAGAGLALVATRDVPAPVRVPLRLAAFGLALTAAAGWCPVYDAQGVTSVGGPGDHPDEAERDRWWVAIRRAASSLEPRP
jgi:glutaredoxin